MAQITQLNPPIPVTTPKGRGLAHFLIDEGAEHDLKWVCFMDVNGECWTYRNQMIRAQKNITQGREYISPFYDPSDVAFPKEKEKDYADEEFDQEYERMMEENEQLKKEMELLQDTKNGLEKICRDQLDEIEKLTNMNRQIIEQYQRPKEKK